MKIISFNVNGLRARLHQLQALIDQQAPDVIGLQEIKVEDSAFPLADIEAMGYQVVYHGQKGHYGVALMSKQVPQNVRKGFPTDEADAQRRMITADYQAADGSLVTVMNGYFPQGESVDHDVKFPAKRRFYQDLQQWLVSDFNPEQALVVMGDFNISPTDLDIGIGEVNRKRWLKTGKASFQPEEREWFGRLEQWGLVDSYRAQHPDDNSQFSWFDYRSKGFEAEPKRGLRIDTLMVTAPLMAKCSETGIDYAIRAMEKPSDHCPVWATFCF